VRHFFWELKELCPGNGRSKVSEWITTPVNPFLFEEAHPLQSIHSDALDYRLMKTMHGQVKEDTSHILPRQEIHSAQ